jgi:hypothetical protein
MRIRFLRTTASSRPGFPFAAGQIIDVPSTEEVLAWLKPGPDGERAAEVIGEDAPEAAVLPPVTQQSVHPKATRADRRVLKRDDEEESRGFDSRHAASV